MSARHRSRPLLAGSLALGFLFLACPRASLAYRPFDSTDASVALPGDVEIELGPMGFLDDAGRRFLVLPDLVLNVGLTEGLEIVAQGRYLRLLDGAAAEPRARVTGTGLFLKGVLRAGSLQGKEGPSIATELGLLLPTLHDTPGAGALATAILSQRWPLMAVHINATLSMSRAQNADFLGGVILEGPHAWRVRPVAEFFAEREIHRGSTLSLLTGVIGRLGDDLSLDVGVRIAWVDGALAREVRGGVTWAFPIGSPR